MKDLLKRNMEENWSLLEKYRLFGVTVLTILTISLNTKFRSTILTSALKMENPIFDIFYLSLFVVTIILILFWIFAVTKEMSILKKYLWDFLLSLPGNPTIPIMLVVVIALSSLTLFSCNILVYSSIFLLFKLVEILGLCYLHSKIRDGLAQARYKIITPEEKTENVLTAYREGDGTSSKPELSEEGLKAAWLVIENHSQRQQVQLAVAGVFFSFVSVILSFLALCEPLSATTFINFLAFCEPLSQPIAIGAYVMMLAYIISNEIIYIIWRGKRDKKLDKITILEWQKCVKRDRDRCR